MKTVLFPVLISSALVLTACGGDDSPSKAPAPEVISQPTVAVKVAAAEPVSALERGEQIYKRCKACHTVNEGGRNRVGPNLWDIVGRDAAAVEDFAYSQAMEESGVVWTEENLSTYLLKPSAFVPGGRMAFAGLRDEYDRDAVIAYLKAQSPAAQ